MFRAGYAAQAVRRGVLSLLYSNAFSIVIVVVVVVALLDSKVFL